MASTSLRTPLWLATALGLTAALLLGTGGPASAATVLDGPVDLGTAATYGVLATSEITNTGPSVVNGDVGLSPGTSITGFGGLPDGVVNGTVHQTDAEAAQAQDDATGAYGIAASLSPTQTGVGELNGLSLTPGVYTGGELSLAGAGILTLEGAADSVWVFQASSTLTIGGASQIVITGGANACNVFWQVGSSATIQGAADFQGTVLAAASVTAVTGASIEGRLIALNGAVTLDTNDITAPTGCPPPGTVSEVFAPTITSGAPTDATAGTAYEFTVTAEGTPTPTFTLSGELPAGLTFDEDTGVISGTPTSPGTSTFTVTAANGIAPETSETYTITVEAPAQDAAVTVAEDTDTGVVEGTELAVTGPVTPGLVPVAIALIAGGVALAIVSERRRVRVAAVRR
ncbi:ice-binding family protein [Demequina muriae]|uniref:Ice-binding family protein n=1 Tax=Demequina muriae TaxID=3051664 RepID=A0ABT8GGF7_9MICO|nr:ice-binding family protein [Demequina sp. EGI L300058]MDN4480523.1 ice-binding family protein [Demequina sp. EGI L300058]